MPGMPSAKGCERRGRPGPDMRESAERFRKNIEKIFEPVKPWYEIRDEEKAKEDEQG